MKIVIDGFGGDYSPDEIIKGAVLSIQKHKDLEIILTGDEKVLTDKFSELNLSMERIKLHNAPLVISNDETPTIAIKKEGTSLGEAFNILKQQDDVQALISCGSTGAILAGGFLKIGRIKGVSRPALAPFLPTRKGTNVLLIDCGANSECKPINLAHFAIMGSIYYKEINGVDSPRVGLLSNGVEEHKGSELTRDTYKMLKSLPINFVGNIEARDIVSGDVDVVVTDGFTGNIALKSIEGAVKLAMGEVKSAIKSSVFSMFGALFLKKAFKKVKAKMDYKKYGGSPFLGTKKLIIKSHGNSKRETICYAVDQAIECSKLGINSKFADAFANLDISGDL